MSKKIHQFLKMERKKMEYRENNMRFASTEIPKKTKNFVYDVNYNVTPCENYKDISYKKT